MQDLELTWETLEFHFNSALEMDIGLANRIKVFSDKLRDSTSPSEKEINTLGNILYSVDTLNNIYKKQNASLSELIGIYKYHLLHGIPIPIEREVSISYLIELKDTNTALIKQFEVQKEDLKNLLG